MCVCVCVCVCVCRYEDARALHGGVDGMQVTAKILESSAYHLKPGG